MKVVTQEIGTGVVSVVEAPAPAPKAAEVVVRSRATLVSAGTERMLLEFGRSNFLDKVRSQPDKAKQVLEKVAADGLLPTLAAVRDKLGDTTSPGYCQAGVVVGGGGPGTPFAAGDRVVTNGSHAELVRVPYHLAAHIPGGVSFEAAAFTPLASIALQGLRLARPTLGETIVVFGLGLVGQLSVQIVRANGCRCIGIDTDPARVALAESYGAIGLRAGHVDVVEAVREATHGAGADAVLMTLATDSDEPMHQAAGMSRKRGRIVLVGVTGLGLRRADFYEKELTFQVSCSYGPGRYDPAYEQGGRDYPLPFVRWTEQRNFQAVLRLMADGQLDVDALVTHRFPVVEAADAYELLLSDAASLGIILEYPVDEAPEAAARTVRLSGAVEPTPGQLVAGVVGAGTFARRTLIPAIRAAGIRIEGIVSSQGLSAAVEAERAGASFAGSDVETLLSDSGIDAVFILTRHDTHADLVRRSLEAGKHVFVEKPLALSLAELDGLRATLDGAGKLLTVGFNRRFAPLSMELRHLLRGRSGPLSLILTVNAGHIERDHWTQDPARGGGRIVGEACHFIDLARFLVGTPITGMAVRVARDAAGGALDDVAHLTFTFEDGSTAVVHYLSTGSRRFPKERVEAFVDGRTAVIENWRRLRSWGFGRPDRPFGGRQDKGHEAELAAYARAVRAGGPPPIPHEELFEVSDWSIRAAAVARGEGEPPG